MKSELIYWVLLFPIISFSQSDKVIVNYKSLLNDSKDEFGSFLYEKGQLITTKYESIYIETPLDTVVNLRNSGEYSTHGLNYKFTYFKKLNENSVFQDRNYGLKEIIKDDNYKIIWKITSNTKKILTYTCQEATGIFRGRKYRAYFLQDIPISSGPFKFDGLPGLILQVESTDGEVSIAATDITYDEGNVSNPFINVGHKTWSEFTNYYQLRFEKTVGVKQNGTEVFIPKRYIEYFLN